MKYALLLSKEGRHESVEQAWIVEGSRAMNAELAGTQLCQTFLGSSYHRHRDMPVLTRDCQY